MLSSAVLVPARKPVYCHEMFCPSPWTMSESLAGNKKITPPWVGSMVGIGDGAAVGSGLCDGALVGACFDARAENGATPGGRGGAGGAGARAQGGDRHREEARSSGARSWLRCGAGLWSPPPPPQHHPRLTGEGLGVVGTGDGACEGGGDGPLVGFGLGICDGASEGAGDGAGDGIPVGALVADTWKNWEEPLISFEKSTTTSL